MTTHAKFWLAWAVIGFIYEMVMILSGRPEGTLSWQVWGLRNAHWPIFTAIWALIGWSLYHFRYEGRGTGEGIKSFAVVVGMWVIFSFVLTPPDNGISARVSGADSLPTTTGGGPPPMDL